MANPEHLRIMRQGTAAWNEWRRLNPGLRPDLTGADFSGLKMWTGPSPDPDPLLGRMDLRGADFSACDLAHADFEKQDLSGATLRGANLALANLEGAKLLESVLSGTILEGAVYSDSTSWPPGYYPADHGARLKKDSVGAEGLVSRVSRADFPDLSITFDSSLSPHQVRGLLAGLADYYRACGGVGFEIDFELEDYAREKAVA